MATDPVCGMYVDESTATLTLFRDNRTYYFCASSCRDAFAAPSDRLRQLRRQLALAWPFAVVAALATYLVFPYSPFVAAAAATVVQFGPGRSFYRGTLDALRSRLGNMDVLIAVGTTAAYAYSLLALLLPARLPPALFFDASSLIIALILTGNYLEQLTRHRATGALRRLGEMLPPRAHRIGPHGDVEVPLSEVQLRDRLRVRPGERFPVDGRVLDGRSAVDESLLTGESAGVVRGPGDAVLAGAVNGDGMLVVETTRVGADTFLAHVGALLSEAESQRVPLQRLANRIAAAFVPAILTLAVLASVGWAIWGGADLTVAVLVFVAVAITACPCAFGIATPAAIVVGTGRAAEAGILFAGEDAISRAARTSVVLTDKTGTLTSGQPRLVGIVPLGPVSEPEILRLAAGIERGSEHPLARAVLAAANTRNIVVPEPADLRVEPGSGVRGSVEGRAVRLLSGAAARAEGFSGEAAAHAAGEAESAGRTWSVLQVGGAVVGLLEFEDTVRPGAAAAVSALRRLGIETVMVTGDAAAPAHAVASLVGISTVHSGATPEEKLRLVAQYRRDGRSVAFVGDGVNDAPALAAADVGIAIGTGSDVAKEAGQVLLLRPEFAGVPRAVTLARRTVGKVRGNLVWALGYNGVLLPIAAGALVPLLGFGVYAVLPLTGAVAMALSSTTVVLNSLSLRWTRLP